MSCSPVRFVGILGSFQLDLEPLGTDLKPVHSLDGTLGCLGVVVADEAEALAEVGDLVNENLGTEYVAEGGKHLNQIVVGDVVGKVVNKKI